MDPCRLDGFFDPHSARCHSQCAEVARRPEGSEIRDACRHSEGLGINDATVVFDRAARHALTPGI
jgi:hypothetical protein